MKVNELRLGNLTLDKDNKIFEIVTITEISVFKKDAYVGMPIGWIKPIPITEEWLLRFGFLKYKGNNKDFWLNDFEFANELKWIFWKGNILDNIKSVHQLQNLYFALTGEELEIKKPIQMK